MVIVYPESHMRQLLGTTRTSNSATGIAPDPRIQIAIQGAPSSASSDSQCSKHQRYALEVPLTSGNNVSPVAAFKQR